MRKFLRRFFCALLSLVLVAAVSTAIAVPAVIRSRGDLSDYMVSEEFQESMTNMGEIYRFLDQDQVKERLDQDYEMIQQLLEENPDALNR